MSFSSQTKEELLRTPAGKSCCMLAELSALTQTSGSLSFLGGGNMRVTYRTEGAALARRLFLLLRDRVGVSPTVTYIRRSQLGGRNTSALTLEGEDAVQLLTALGMMGRGTDGSPTLLRTAPHLPLTRQCCRRAFLRAAFLGCGTMTAPDRQYHLEWVCSSEALMQELVRQLEKSGVPASSRERAGKTVVYLKTAQSVSDTLALMGASGAMLETENTRIRKMIRGNANRANNCDDHNSERMINAAQAQVQAIRLLALNGGLHTLPPPLRTLANLRLAHPELSLTELGQLTDPELSKNAVSHRMHRLMALAAELREELAAQAPADPERSVPHDQA